MNKNLPIFFLLLLVSANFFFHGLDLIFAYDPAGISVLWKGGGLKSVFITFIVIGPFLFTGISFLAVAKAIRLQNCRWPFLVVMVASLAYGVGLFWCLRTRGSLDLSNFAWLTELMLIIILSFYLWLNREKVAPLPRYKKTLLVSLAVPGLVLTAVTAIGIQSADQFVKEMKVVIPEKFCQSSGYKVCVPEDFCKKLASNMIDQCAKQLKIYGMIRPQLASSMQRRFSRCSLVKADARISLNRGYKRCLNSHHY